MVTDVLEPEAGRNLVRNTKPKKTKSLKSLMATHMSPANERDAVIKIIKGRTPSMRQIFRTHRVNLEWLFDWTNLDPGTQIKYVCTFRQIADILTRGSFSRERWSPLKHVLNPMTPHVHASSHKAAVLSYALKTPLLNKSGCAICAYALHSTNSSSSSMNLRPGEILSKIRTELTQQRLCRQRMLSGTKRAVAPEARRVRRSNIEQTARRSQREAESKSSSEY